MPLSKEQILSANDCPREPVPVPEWGGDVFVRVMRADEHDQWRAELNKHKATDSDEIASETWNALLIVFTVCDDNGALLFSVDDLAKLRGRNFKVLDQVASKAYELNRIDGKAREQFAKNSESGPR